MIGMRVSQHQIVDLFDPFSPQEWRYDILSYIERIVRHPSSVDQHFCCAGEFDQGGFPLADVDEGELKIL